MKTSNTFKNGLLLALIFLFTFTYSYSQTFKKGPYLLLNGNNSEMQVLWQTDVSSIDQLQWGTDLNYTSGSTNNSEYGSDHQHKYAITGLTAGAKYYYKLTVGSTVKTGSFTAAPPSDATSVKFFAYGDTRTNVAEHNSVAGQMISTYTSDAAYQTMVISMGDLVYYGNDENYWTSEFFTYGQPNITTMLANLPYQSCIGNHELSGTSTLFPKYFPYSFAGSRYYSFDYGPAHFAVVDQYTEYAVGSTQYNWLVSDLANSNKSWKFIYLHEPGWSAAGGHVNNVAVQAIIEPLCEQFNVPILFAGHNHYYARAVVNQNGKQVQHVTTGGGGAPIATPDPLQPNIVKTAASYHFCKINIVNQYVLQFEAISKDGASIDAFTIDRTPSTIVISNIQSGNITTNSAQITWTTDVAASSDVEYGTSTSYGSSASGTSGTTSHAVLLSGLQPNTIYHYRVKSNETYSGDYTFNTLTPVPVITQYAPVSVSITSGTLSSGTFGNLATNNNSYYVVNSTNTKPRNCEWMASFTIAQTASEVSRLTVTYDGKYNRSIAQLLYLYDFASGSWVQIDSRNVSTKDITIQFVQNSPANFISNSREVRVKVSSLFSSKNYICSGDFMEIAIEVPALKNALIEPDPKNIASLQNFKQDRFYNFPNPSQSKNTIHFELEEPSIVSVSLNNLTGNKIIDVVRSTKQEKGVYEVMTETDSLPAGIYFYTLTIQTDKGSVIRKLSKLIIF